MTSFSLFSLRRFLLSALCGASLLSPVYVLAADDSVDTLTDEQREQLTAICDRIKRKENRDRCVDRMLSRLQDADRAAVSDSQEQREEAIIGICDQKKERNYDRCVARQRARAERIANRNGVENAHDFYQEQDWGETQLRSGLVNTRNSTFNEAAEQRKTFRQYEDQDNLNTELNPYINDLYHRRLACMLMRPGRTRSLCLEGLAQDMRQEMQDRREERIQERLEGSEPVQ